MNVLELTGPEFLSWYLQWSLTAAALLAVLRWTLIRGAAMATATTPAPYEIAWLRGGPTAVFHAALSALFQRGLILERDGRLNAVDIGLPAWLPPVELAVLRGFGEGSRRVTTALRAACEPMVEHLVRDGVALSLGRRLAIRLLAPLGLVLCFAMGVAKLALGIDRGRPIGLLVLLLLLTAAASLAALLIVPRMTIAGKRRLHQLRDGHAALRTTMSSAEPGPQEPGDVALAVGLWGVGALAAPAFLPLVTVLTSAPAHASSSSGGCGADGGGGCGGGGCGGGGCGGCGG
jgi:uncharacterized protein (TIGR04222 family)